MFGHVVINVVFNSQSRFKMSFSSVSGTGNINRKCCAFCLLRLVRLVQPKNYEKDFIFCGLSHWIVYFSFLLDLFCCLHCLLVRRAVFFFFPPYYIFFASESAGEICIAYHRLNLINQLCNCLIQLRI